MLRIFVSSQFVTKYQIVSVKLKEISLCFVYLKLYFNSCREFISNIYRILLQSYSTYVYHKIQILFFKNLLLMKKTRTIILIKNINSKIMVFSTLFYTR